MDDTCNWTTVAAGFASGCMQVVKICEITYALKVVGDQTKHYIQTAQRLSENLSVANKLFRSIYQCLSIEQRTDLEHILDRIHLEARAIQTLLDPAKVDLDKDKRLCFSMRGMWVLHDSQDTSNSLGRLQTALQELDRAISMLRTLERSQPSGQRPNNNVSSIEEVLPVLESSKDASPKSSAGGDQLLQWRRMQRAARRSSAPGGPLPTRSPVNVRPGSTVNVYEMAAPWTEFRPNAPVLSKGNDLNCIASENRLHELEGSPGYYPYRKENKAFSKDAVELPTTSDTPSSIQVGDADYGPSQSPNPASGTLHQTRSKALNGSIDHESPLAIHTTYLQSAVSLDDFHKTEPNIVMRSATTRLTQRKSWLLHQAGRLQPRLKPESSKSSLSQLE